MITGTTEDAQCYACEATFRCEFEMDTRTYQVTFCPFCGSDDIDHEIRTEDEEEDVWE